MAEVNLFEVAARKQFRYAASVGDINTEDLWGLPLTHARSASLDDVARRLSRVIRSQAEESFVDDKDTSADTELQQKLEIVKYIIAYKKNQAEVAKKSAETRAQNAKIIAILAKKEDADLENKTPEELRAMLLQSNGG